MFMKKMLDFLKYNNAVPFLFFALLLGAGTALATSPQLRQSVFTPGGTIPSAAPAQTDTSKLLDLNIKELDLDLRIDTLTEDRVNYYVSYSYQTWAVVDFAWQEMRKVGKMDIPKALLGKRDLKTYLIEQIGQVMDREIAYLGEAQTIARAVVAPKQSSGYASLVGSTVKKDDVLAVRAETASEIPVKKESKLTDSESMAIEMGSGPAKTVLSKEEIEKIIVSAVAEFLAVDMSMPSIENNPVPQVENTFLPDEVTSLMDTPEEPALEAESPSVP